MYMVIFTKMRENVYYKKKEWISEALQHNRHILNSLFQTFPVMENETFLMITDFGFYKHTIRY